MPRAEVGHRAEACLGENGYECAVRCLRQIPDDPLGQFSGPCQAPYCTGWLSCQRPAILPGSLSGICWDWPCSVPWVSVKQTDSEASDQGWPLRKGSWSLAHSSQSHTAPPLCLSFVMRESWLLRNPHLSLSRSTLHNSVTQVAGFSPPSNSQKQHLRGFELGKLELTAT